MTAPQNDLLSILSPVRTELNSFEKELGKCISSQNPVLDNILNHIVSSGGKRLRPAMIFLMTKALNSSIVTEKHMKLALSVELTHTATLIHDDVVDNSTKRRNVSTINSIWGDKTAILSGDYLLSKALNLLMQLENKSVVELFSNNLSEICIGEIQQLSQTNQTTTIEEYIEKSRRKTALLFATGAKSSAILSNADEKTLDSVYNFAINFGIVFQIIDDILNFAKNADKPVGLDIQNGIYTAPVIFAMEENLPELNRLLKKENLNKDETLKIIEIVNSSNGTKKAKKLAENYAQNALIAIETINPSIYTKSLKDLTNYIIKKAN